MTSTVLHKKRCECKFIVNARSAKSAGESLREHCEHSKCQAINAKNV